MNQLILNEGWKTTCSCAPNAADLPDSPWNDWKEPVIAAAGPLGISVALGRDCVEGPAQEHALAVLLGVMHDAQDGSPIPPALLSGDNLSPFNSSTR